MSVDARAGGDERARAHRGHEPAARASAAASTPLTPAFLPGPAL